MAKGGACAALPSGLRNQRADLDGELLEALRRRSGVGRGRAQLARRRAGEALDLANQMRLVVEGVAERVGVDRLAARDRSEEQKSELQSLMRNSYAVFCLNNKKHQAHG